MLRSLNIILSLLVAVAMTVTSLPEAHAAPASKAAPGVSTLCDGAGCMSVLDTYGAKKYKAKKRPGKRPAYKPGKPGKPGMNRPGKPNRPDYKPGKPNRPGANRPGKPNRPGYRPGKPGKPTTLPSFRPGDNRPNKPGYKPNRPNYRPPNWHHRPIYYRPYYRPWRYRDWYGAAFAGVILGTIIVVAANTPPPAPSSELCWYWSNNARTKGYWDYCY